MYSKRTLVSCWIYLLTAIPLVLFSPFLHAWGAEPIILDGSTGMLPLARALAKAYQEKNPDPQIELGKGLGTGARLRALAEGKIHIALASHGIEADDIQKGNLKVLEVAKGAIIFAVNASVPLGKITDSQVCDVYRGKIRNWESLAGLILSTELSGKRLELLKETFPRVTRVAVLWNPSNQSSSIALKETQAASQALAIQLQPLEVRSLKDLEDAFESATRIGAHAIITLPDALINTHHRRISDFAAKNRLPAMYAGPEFVEAGGLMSYAPSYTDQFRRAAIFVDKILKGAKPADLPVEQPTKFELVINLKTAKQIGLTIPQSVLYRADKVIR